jgi:ectoine hydroxylase-related dioxygenase (phytanoyl-CoA dioxygenase family)
MQTATASIESQGFTVVPDVLDTAACASISNLLDASPVSGAGSRRLLMSVWCQDLAAKLRSNTRIASLLPRDAVAVQCTLFDKSPDKNWLVALHQDRSIPVRERLADAGLSGWSEKEGDIFVQPPHSLLEQLAAVRVHIDSCSVQSGPLRVVPGSHRLGLLSTPDAEECRARVGEVVIPAAQGDTLVMKPLILHASSKGSSSARRRVLHFVVGPRTLPLGLQWRHAI